MAQNIDVSIIPQSYLPEIKVSENDDSLRVIRVSIIDENGEAYQIPSGVTATFAGTKPSGLGFTVPCTIDGSAVQFVMEDTVCNEAGRFPAEVRLINGEARIGTCNVLINVEPNPHPDDTTDGDREPLVNEITALLHAIEEQSEQVAENTRTVEQAMDAWTNMSAEAETLAPGSDATASYNSGVLSLGIPSGPEGTPGQDGQDGVGIANVQLNSDYTLTITLTDGRTYTTTSIRGEQGETGLTPDFTIGTVTTLAPGSQATATITGTDEEPVLNLGIPKGDPGDVSSTGYYPDLYAGGLTTDKGAVDKAPYLFRASPSLGYAYNRESGVIVGGTVAWNQLAPILNSTNWTSESGVTATYSDGVATISSTVARNGIYFRRNIIANHKYLVTCELKSESAVNVLCGSLSGLYVETHLSGGEGWKRASAIQYRSADQTSFRLYIYGTIENYNIQAKNFMLIDLTAMFGSTIADYIYSLEQATAGSGIAWLRSYGFLTEDYYAYNAGELMSVNTSAHNTVGFNQWDEETRNGYYDTNGVFRSYASNLACKNLIEVIPNAVYHLHCGTVTAGFGRICFYDSEENCISTSNISGSIEYNVTTPSDAHYFAFDMQSGYGTTYNHDICINLNKTTGTPKNGDYVPYVKHTYALDSDLTLRGIPKLDASNNLYYDGDIYESDGTVTRKYVLVDVSTLTFTTRYTGNTKKMVSANIGGYYNVSEPNMMGEKYPYIRAVAGAAALSDVDNETYGCYSYSGGTRDYSLYIVLPKDETPSGHILYKADTPTTETADPYTNPQVVDPDGTEEYVTSGIVPVGHETLYIEDLKGKLEDIPDIPEAPASNGTYTLKAVRSNSGVTYSWVSG